MVQFVYCRWSADLKNKSKEYVHQKKDHCCSFLGTAFARERLLSELGHVKTVEGTGTKKGTVSFSNPWTIWACLPSLAGATFKARYAAPTREDCTASTISVAFFTSWPSIIMNYCVGLDRCHLTRSLIFALLDHENLYYYSINAPFDFSLLSFR